MTITRTLAVLLSKAGQFLEDLEAQSYNETQAMRRAQDNRVVIARRYRSVPFYDEDGEEFIPHMPGRRYGIGAMGIGAAMVPAGTDEEPGRAMAEMFANSAFQPAGAIFSAVPTLGEQPETNPLKLLTISHLSVGEEKVIDGEEMLAELLNPTGHHDTRIEWPRALVGARVRVEYVNRNPYPVTVIGTFTGHNIR